MHLLRENYLQNLYQDKLCIVRPTLIYGSNDPHNGYGLTNLYGVPYKEEI